ncbi:hypothetical protein C6A85_15125, partial [Mycobacterium sp. ITM-2017-0098]
FHSILTEAGVPYCVAVLARVSRSPLDPDQRESRPLDDDEVAMQRNCHAVVLETFEHGHFIVIQRP